MKRINQKIQTFRITDRILDLFLLFLSARLAIIAERIYHGKSWGGLDPQSFNFYALIIIFAIWLILIQIFENAQSYRRIHIWDIFRNTTFINFIGVTTTITLDFFLKTDFFKRSTIIYFGFISFILFLLKRIGIKHFLSFVRQEGLDPKNILIIGSHKRAERLICEFKENSEYGLKVVSLLDPDPKRIGHLVGGMRVSGDMTLFKREIRELKIDDVFFTLNPDDILNVDTLFRYMDIIGINYHLILDEAVKRKFSTQQRIEPITTNYSGLSMISYYAIAPNPLKLYNKVLIERTLALLILMLLSPIILLFSLLIKITSDFPIFLKEERIGLRGRNFNYYIFNLQNSSNNINGEYEKYIKKLIEKLKLKEIPALINIIKGDMNFIGPYPMLRSDYYTLSSEYSHRKLSMKPGLTGLWRAIGITGNNDMQDQVEIDLEYIDNWSFGLDIKIALKTMRMVFSSM